MHSCTRMHGGFDRAGVVVVDTVAVSRSVEKLGLALDS